MEITSAVDLIVFAGQSNMAGRGTQRMRRNVFREPDMNIKRSAHQKI